MREMTHGSRDVQQMESIAWEGIRKYHNSRDIPKTRKRSEETLTGSCTATSEDDIDIFDGVRHFECSIGMENREILKERGIWGVWECFGRELGDVRERFSTSDKRVPTVLRAAPSSQCRKH
jgi:hypothetical protein